MRIGLAVPQTGLLADPTAVRAVAVAAEKAGYHGLWVSDGVLAPLNPADPWPGNPGGERPPELHGTLDPFGTLAVAAACTEGIGLGTGVLVAPWYPPVLLARALTSLDRISAGRLTVGVGTGWSRDEYAAVGASFAGREEAAEECLDVLDAIWRSEVVAFEGTRTRIVPSEIRPKPIQTPPRVLIAAYTLDELDRVARRADGWIPTGLPPSTLGPMWANVRSSAEDRGRDPNSLHLVVRADIRLTRVPLGSDRPPYWGTPGQIVGDLDATREAGADEGVLQLAQSARSADELLEVAADLRERLGEASAA